MFKAGFVNIIGKPNVGKSTLINSFVGEKISIVTPKAQTTRHRVLGIVNGEGYQIVFSDTPGIIKPKYLLHEAMMKFVDSALEDADILLLMVEPDDSPASFEFIIRKVKSKKTPVLLLINKIDTSDQERVFNSIKIWSKHFPVDDIIPISALNGFNLQKLNERILELLPENPPFYDDDIFTDRTERFIVSETIREKIFMHYKQEIPYSVEVAVFSFKEEESIIRIQTEIIVARKSQKPILIGKGGESLKRIGTEARKELELFFNKKIFLELFVKVREDWRDKPVYLKEYGYKR